MLQIRPCQPKIFDLYSVTNYNPVPELSTDSCCAGEDQTQSSLAMPAGWTREPGRTPETELELIDSHSSQRKAASYVDG